MGDDGGILPPMLTQEQAVEIATFISYALFALEELGAKLEDPFGLEPNDLPLTALCMGIAATLREALGESNIVCPDSIDFALIRRAGV